MLNTTKLFILAAVIMIGGIAVANAQVAPQSEIKTNVPFSFVVNDKTFPAGTYTFGRLATNGGGDSTQLVMRGPKGATAILDTIPTIAANAPSKTNLVFDKVAGQYFLKQIWGAGDAEGNELIVSNAQKTAIATATSGAASDATSGVDGN
jgi:hypothetical protein